MTSNVTPQYHVPAQTLGGNRGSGHFYLAKNRTFLLCVDTKAYFAREANEGLRFRVEGGYKALQRSNHGREHNE